MKYVCLNCNCSFRKWRKIENSKNETCPLCGISKKCGQYEKEKQIKI